MIRRIAWMLFSWPVGLTLLTLGVTAYLVHLACESTLRWMWDVENGLNS